MTNNWKIHREWSGEFSICLS